MACKNCIDPNDLTVFRKVESDDSEYYIEPVRSAWSIITPVSGLDVTNLFRNGSFEEAFDPSPAFGEWLPDSTVSSAGIGGKRVTTEAFSGAYSMQFYEIVQYQTPWLSSAGNLFPRTKGITYCVSMMVKTCCDHKVRAGIYNTTDGWLAYNEIVGNGCWQLLSFCIAADAGPNLVADIITSYLTLTSDLQCLENYVDLITVTATPETHITDNRTDTSYCECYTPFDGDSVNAHWTGNAHSSTSVMSAYSRSIGKKTPLSDFDFNVIAYTGHGLPPIVTPSAQFARRSGASVQRARANSRTITITGEMCADSWKNLDIKKEALINALGLNLSGDCDSSREIFLSYECVDDCGVVTGNDMRIRVNYNGGLDGARSQPYCERITLSFIANSDPTWHDNKQYCRILTPGVDAVVNNCGNDYAPIRLFGYNNATLNLKSIENKSTGKKVVFGATAAGYSATGTNDLIFANSPGSTSFKEVNAGVSTDLGSQLTVSDTSRPSQFLLAPGKNTIRLEGAVTGFSSRFVLCWRNKHLSGSAACGSCECEQT